MQAARAGASRPRTRAHTQHGELRVKRKAPDVFAGILRLSRATVYWVTAHLERARACYLRGRPLFPVRAYTEDGQPRRGNASKY